MWFDFVRAINRFLRLDAYSRCNKMVGCGCFKSKKGRPPLSNKGSKDGGMTNGGRHSANSLISYQSVASNDRASIVLDLLDDALLADDQQELKARDASTAEQEKEGLAIDTSDVKIDTAQTDIKGPATPPKDVKSLDAFSTADLEILVKAAENLITALRAPEAWHVLHVVEKEADALLKKHQSNSDLRGGSSVLTARVLSQESALTACVLSQESSLDGKLAGTAYDPGRLLTLVKGTPEQKETAVDIDTYEIDPDSNHEHAMYRPQKSTLGLTNIQTSTITASAGTITASAGTVQQLNSNASLLSPPGALSSPHSGMISGLSSSEGNFSSPGGESTTSDLGANSLLAELRRIIQRVRVLKRSLEFNMTRLSRSMQIAFEEEIYSDQILIDDYRHKQMNFNIRINYAGKGRIKVYGEAGFIPVDFEKLGVFLTEVDAL